MKFFQKLCKNRKTGITDITEEEWGEAMASLYKNELSNNEEEWEIRRNKEGKKVAYELNNLKEDNL